MASMLFVDISDTGKGITLKHRNNVFRPGFSTKKRGWGLGLSLSKRIIETYHSWQAFPQREQFRIQNYISYQIE